MIGLIYINTANELKSIFQVRTSVLNLIKKKLKLIPLDILGVGVSNGQVRAQSGQAQGIESPGSILVVPQIILSIARKMVHLDVVAHLQQLVQARGWLTGIHVD